MKITAGALGSDIRLGNGSDSADFEESSQSNQSFSVDGGKGGDAVNFALDQSAYTITESGDESYTVVDANGNSYALSSISSLTFNGIAFQPGNPENQAPVVSSPSADQTSTEDTAFSFQVAAFTDPDGDALTYTATQANGSALPGWLTFDAASRTFSGTPGESDVGTVSVRVTASDGSLSSSDDFTITVNSAPIVVPPGPTIVDPVVTGGVLYLDHFYDYDVSEGGGMIAVSYAGKNMLFNASSITDVVTVGSSSVDIDTSGWTVRGIEGDVNYTNVSFTEAGPGSPTDVKFESTFELGPDAIPTNGDATVNGSAANYFRAAWDWLDDHYTPSPANYYAEELNSFGIDLGIQYAQYLENGGTPLFDIAKFDSSTGRVQTLHDNLLGNLDENSILDKFNAKSGPAEVYTPAEIYARIQAAGLGDYLGVVGNINDGRGIFTGNLNDIDSAAHDRVRAFDYANGIARSDYHSFTSSGSVDVRARNGAEMYFGDGNTPNNWVISQHEGAGIETALKVHHRGGADYAIASTSGEIVKFDVMSGTASGSTTRAEWNFDYAITTGLNGTTTDLDDFDFQLKIDKNSGAGVDYMIFNLEGSNGNTPFVARDGNGAIIGVSGEDPSSGDGSLPYISQDSVNFGFNFIKNAIDSGGYNFGTGTFDIELVAYENGTNNVLSNVHIQVHVL